MRSGVPCPLPYDARFDGNAACPVYHQPRGRDASGPGRGRKQLRGCCDDGAARRPSRLPPVHYKRLGAMRAAPPSVPDAPKPDVEIIIADHGTHEVRAVVTLQGVVRIDRLSCAVAPRARWLMCLNSSAARPSRSLRLLSCRRAVECSALPHLLDECTTTCDMLRTVLESLIMASCRLVPR